MCLIKYEDVETVIIRAVSPNAKIIDYRMEPFTKNRQFGIMGDHYELAVDIKDDSSNNTTRTIKFFVKTPPESPAMRDTLVDDWVTYEEVHFFDKIYPLMIRECKAMERWSPVCYLAKIESLVFEDLRSQGYVVRQNRVFKMNDLKAVLSTLARFHASSFLLERKLGKPLNEVFPQAFREKIFTDVGKGGRCNQLGFETMEWMAKRFRLDSGIVSTILKRLCELVKPRTGSWNVICHGDLWRSNIMFSDSSSSLTCLLVDYQMLRYASPMIDVAMLLYVRTTQQFRQSSELEMLEYYYSVFRETLDSQSKIALPIYQSLLEDYQQCKLVGMAYSALRWPPIVFAKVLGDPIALERWYFQDRIDVYQKALDDDPAYEAEIRGYLVELFDEAKRVLDF